MSELKVTAHSGYSCYFLPSAMVSQVQWPFPQCAPTVYVALSIAQRTGSWKSSFFRCSASCSRARFAVPYSTFLHLCLHRHSYRIGTASKRQSLNERRIAICRRRRCICEGKNTFQTSQSDVYRYTFCFRTNSTRSLLARASLPLTEPDTLKLPPSASTANKRRSRGELHGAYAVPARTPKREPAR